MMSKSSTTTKLLPPIHPGEILREEFLVPLNMTAYRLAKDIGVPLPKINDIVLERRGISADTALRLAHYFGMSAEFWSNLQARYELEVERDRMGDKLATIVKFQPRATASEPLSRKPVSTSSRNPARSGRKG